MLRFFMKYRSYIIVSSIGMAMLAFVVGPYLMKMFTPTPGQDAIGTIDGQKIIVVDQNIASIELRTLDQLAGGSMSGQVLRHLGGGDPMQWLLMVTEAEQMGLSASDTEINDLLGRIDIQTQNLDVVASQIQSSPEMIRRSLKHWIMIQQYRELVLGLGHLTMDDRFDTRPGSLLGTLLTIRQQQEQGLGESPYFMQLAMMQLGQATTQSLGQPRLSTPVLERLLSDLNANMKVDMVVLNAADFVSKDQAADAAIVEDLFAKYKDNLAGDSEPYGFGYAFADRVKLEYLYLPFDSVLEKVTVEPADALAYYDTNKDSYRDPADADGNPGNVKSYEQVRDEIMRSLRDQKARELAGKIMSKAQAILIDDARGLKKEGGYYVTEGADKEDKSDDFKPMSFGDVSSKLAKEFNIAVSIFKRGRQWQDREAMAKLPHITADMANGFANYVLSVHELDPEGLSTMASRRLQVNIPSMPLTSREGNMWLIRVNAADAKHTPATLAEVKNAVEADAKLLGAYQQLLADQASWLAKAREQGLEKLAEANGSKVVSSRMFSRREASFDGSLNIPTLDEEIGQDAEMIDQLFELADGAAASGQSVTEVPVELRTGVMGIDGKQSLVLVELGQFLPMEKSTYRSQVKMPALIRSVNQMLSDQSLYKESFEWQVLSDRVGYEPERGSSDSQEDVEGEEENAASDS